MSMKGMIEMLWLAVFIGACLNAVSVVGLKTRIDRLEERLEWHTISPKEVKALIEGKAWVINDQIIYKLGAIEPKDMIIVGPKGSE